MRCFQLKIRPFSGNSRRPLFLFKVPWEMLSLWPFLGFLPPPPAQKAFRLNRRYTEAQRPNTPNTPPAWNWEGGKSK